MRAFLLVAAVLALPASAQEAPEPVNPNRCVIQNATGPEGSTLQLHLTRDGKVFAGDDTVAASEVEALVALVARHLSEAGGAGVRIEQERGTPRRYAEAVMASVKSGYATAGEAPRIALFVSEH